MKRWIYLVVYIIICLVSIMSMPTFGYACLMALIITSVALLALSFGIQVNELTGDK